MYWLKRLGIWVAALIACSAWCAAALVFSVLATLWLLDTFG
jgi:hypothetical protein